MKKRLLFITVFSLLATSIFAQKTKKKSNFWKKVQFGGGINIGFTNNATALGISPSALYNVNDKFGLGLGVSYLYSKYKTSSTALNAYGGSALALYKPFNGMQLSGEFEETFINVANTSREVPALYLGAGYNMGRNIAAGIRYDVLYDENKSLYASPLTPFVRVYF